MYKFNVKKVIFGFISVLLLFQFSLVNAETTYKVKATDNMSKIVTKYYKKSGLTKPQLMIGILADNPKVFRRGNINALKRNELITIPDLSDLKVMDKQQAASLVARHNKHLRNRSKTTIAPPFDDNVSKKVDTNNLVKTQQEKLQKLKKLETERAELLAKLDKLIADEKQMDLQLEEIKKESEK